MNIQERLAKVSFFPVKSDFSSLDENQRRALAHCVNASNIMTFIYLEQAFSGNKKLYRELHARSDGEGKNLFKYFLIQGSPWDGCNHDEPFIPGVGETKIWFFYPADTEDEEHV